MPGALRSLLRPHATLMFALALLHVAGWLALPLGLEHPGLAWFAAALAFGSASVLRVSAHLARRRVRAQVTVRFAREALDRSHRGRSVAIDEVFAAVLDGEDLVLGSAPGLVGTLSAALVTIVFASARVGAVVVVAGCLAVVLLVALRRATTPQLSSLLDADTYARTRVFDRIQAVVSDPGEIADGALRMAFLAALDHEASTWSRAQSAHERAWFARRLVSLSLLAALVALGVHASGLQWSTSSARTLAWLGALATLALAAARQLDRVAEGVRAVTRVCEPPTALGVRVGKPYPVGSPALDVVAATLRYGDRAVLDGVSFRVPASGLLLLVGPNGAGKSTLARAVAGRHAVASGAITVGGYDVSECDPDSITYVPQNPARLALGTVEDNVRLLAPDVGDNAMRVALRDAHVPDDPARALATLSGGEQRRLFVARALLRPSRMLVLDECEAGLDGAGRTWFARVVAGRARDAFVVVVTHRPAMFSSAERVVVLGQGGRVVDFGAPDDVKARCEDYRVLAASSASAAAAVD